MMGVPRVFRNPFGGRDAAVDTLSVGIAEGAIPGIERFTSLPTTFPQVSFVSIEAGWRVAADERYDIVVIGVSATAPDEIEAAINLARARKVARHVVVALRDPDIATTRRLMHGGVSDVVTAPVSEAALALSLERLLTEAAGPRAAPRDKGEVVAVLKAGGGVGATAVCTQMAMILAARGAGVCVADLDLQFGSAGLYLDLPEAVSVADLVGSGSGFADTPYAEVLATHPSGARLLASPKDVVAIETLNPQAVDGMLRGFRRDFALTLVDLPSVWTAWTSQALSGADRILLVTRLTVPHIQLVKRQLRILATQGHDAVPLTLVCNAVSPEQTASVSIKAAERAMGRAFDLVIPDDARVMNQAINQGVEISSVRRGAKLEKAIAQLADSIGAAAFTNPVGRRV